MTRKNKVLIKLTTAVVVMALAYFAMPAAAETNLVANPGFESGVTVPMNWTFVTYNGNTPIWDNASHSGSRSIKISIPGTTDVISGYSKSDLIIAKPLANYTFSAWGKTQGAGGTYLPAVRAVELDANKSWLRQTTIEFRRGTNDWTQKQIDFKTGSDTAYLYVIANIWRGYGIFWVDDVALSLKNSPDNGSIQPGLIAYWDFDENNGTTAYDSSGNGHTGTINGATWASGKLGSALQFDGMDDNVSAGSIASGTSGTMEAWIKPNSYTGSQFVMGGIRSDSADESERYIIFVRGSNCPSGDWGTVVSNGVSVQTACSGQVYNSTNFPSGAWKHIAATYNGSFISFYTDGVQIKTVKQTVSGAGNPQPFSIGQPGAYPWLYFNGNIDEVKIFNRSLSEAEIKAEFDAGSSDSGDTAPPSITLDSPSNGQTVTSSTITVSGSASDNVAISKVEVKVGAGAWQLATGTTSWSTSVTLTSGSNIIAARAIDTLGNIIEASVTVTYTPATPTLMPAPASSPTGNTYYVAKSGNDNNPGTETQPWLTIQKAANTLKSGDTVYIKTGTYKERIYTINSGLPGNYITFAAYPGDAVTIDGNGIPIDSQGYGGGIIIDGKQYIRVSGFKVSNFLIDDSYGVHISRSHHIVIQNNSISNTGSSGIFVYKCAFTNQYIEGNEDIIIEGNDITEANINGNHEGISIIGTTNFVVRNNKVHHVHKEGIDTKVNSAYGKVNKNIVYNTTWHGPGIYIDGHDIEVYQNIVHDFVHGFGVSSEEGTLAENIRIYNNIAYNNNNGYVVSDWLSNGPRRNISIINNVAYANKGNGVYIQSSNIQNIAVRNNILSKNTERQIRLDTSIGVTVDHNLIDGFNSILGTSYVQGDPQFVNPASADFHLLSTSPAIDKGSPTDAPSFDFDGNSRPRGNGYDIGAFEYTLNG